MDDVIAVVCPYCAERVELYLDPDTSGSFVQDCEVCCHPWSVRVARDGEGVPRVEVDRAD